MSNETQSNWPPTCNLEIESWYGSESSSVAGTIQHNGKTLKISVEGSASDRGSHATIDGKKEWWHGEYENDLESTIDTIFEDAWKQVEEAGIDPDDNWKCEYVNGQVQNPKQIEDDEDE